MIKGGGRAGDHEPVRAVVALGRSALAARVLGHFPGQAKTVRGVRERQLQVVITMGDVKAQYAVVADGVEKLRHSLLRQQRRVDVEQVIARDVDEEGAVKAL